MCCRSPNFSGFLADSGFSVLSSTSTSLFMDLSLVECPFRLLKFRADCMVLDRNLLLVLFSGQAGMWVLLLTSNLALDLTISRFSSSMAILWSNRRDRERTGKLNPSFYKYSSTVSHLVNSSSDNFLFEFLIFSTVSMVRWLIHGLTGALISNKYWNQLILCRTTGKVKTITNPWHLKRQL